MQFLGAKQIFQNAAKKKALSRIFYRGKNTKILYKIEVANLLKLIFDYKNVEQIPKILKISINRGLGESTKDSKLLKNYLQELAFITGQRAITTKAHKSIAGFKIRQGMPIGALVTLRGNRMHTFLTKLIHLIIPSIRDFRGLSINGFDGLGNYSLGIDEQLVFPEILYDYVKKFQGFGISIMTTAKTDQESFILLRALGLPLK